jgi:hypothetical protein
LLQRQRGEKNEMSKAALKFNFKAKNGIAYLVQAGLCTKEPKKPEEDKFEDPAEYTKAKETYDVDYMIHKKGLVKFLKTAPTLDKTAVGEFFGKISASYNMDVLDVYLNEYDFTGVFYVNALKIMLSGFRLLGEG